MLVIKSIEIATHLFHIFALLGCGHLLQQGRISEALECAMAGSICVVILASADIIANSIRNK